MRTFHATWLGLIVTVVAGCEASSRAPRAYVTNADDGTVSVIDLQRQQAVSTIDVGAQPRGVRLSGSGMTLYVAVTGTAGESDENTISLVDLETAETIRRLHAGTSPVQSDLVGVNLVVVNRDSDDVALVNIAAGSVRAAVPVGDEPSSVAVAPDETIWVTSEAEGRIDVVDPTYAEAVAKIEVGPRPVQLVFAHDGRRAYVAHAGDASIGVIDVGSRKLVGRIALPDAQAPTALALAHDDGALYVATGTAGTVVTIDTATLEVSRVASNLGARLVSIAIGPDHRLYAVDADADDVAVVDLETGTVTARIPVGASPWGIAVEQAAQD